jgi:hypothetical protein
MTFVRPHADIEKWTSAYTARLQPRHVSPQTLPFEWRLFHHHAAYPL